MSGWHSATPLPLGLPTRAELIVTGVIVAVATVGRVVLLWLPSSAQ